MIWTKETVKAWILASDPKNPAHRKALTRALLFMYARQTADEQATGNTSHRYAPGCARKVASEFPRDEELQRIARDFQETQRKSGYKLEADISQSGHYVHSGTMRLELIEPSKHRFAEDDELLTIMRRFADWIYRGLESEYEYRLSDEAIAEDIRANEYEFYEDGSRADI